MTPSRVVRVLSLLLLFVVPTLAMAATTEFRVFFDVDADATTGCSIGDFDGVEQILVTQVSDDDSTPRVTRTHRQICTGGILGGPTDVVTSGWPAAWRSGDRMMTLETRIPFASFGTGMPESIHVGFDATRGAAVHEAFVNADGTPVMIPSVARRRRAVNDGPARTITLDGSLQDWGNIKPVLFGIQDGGSKALRLLRLLSFANTSDNFLYFAAQLHIGSEAPFADEDEYLRTPGEELAVPPGAGVLKNDGDPNGLPLTATKVSEAARGTVTLNPDGSFTYSPNNPASHLTDEFEYQATNGTNNSNVARVRIKVNVGENPDVPRDDDYETDEDETLVVPAPDGVLANDPGTPNLVASLHTPPAHGTVVLNADGGFTYKPNQNYFGLDTFVYTATLTPNGNVMGNATVTIEINSVNDAPNVQAATFNVQEHAPNGTVIGTVNVTDADQGDDHTWSIVGGNTGGAFAINANTGTITVANSSAINFTPPSTTFSLQVRAQDNGQPSKSNTDIVTINVINQNDAPVAANDTASVNEDGSLTVPAPGVLSNDTDADGDPITAVLVSSTSNGTLTLNANGGYTYTPNANFSGTDTFTYRASDGPNQSNVATVTITVNAINDVPVAVADAYGTNEDVPLNVPAPGVLANDSDVEGPTLTAILVSGTTNGTLTLNPNGSFTYTPNANFSGADSFTYKANDGTADSNTVTVTITVSAVNDVPVAVADAFPVNEDTTLNVPAPGVLANDTDVEGSSLTAVLVSGPANGTLTLNANGSFGYTPNANFSGTDSFTYRANDGTADSNTVTVTITVNPVNDTPVAVADAYSTNEDVQLNVPAPGVLANDTDVDGTPLTAVLVSGPANGTLTLNADGSFTYTPNANYNGSDSFTYKANDGTVDSNTVTVTLTVNAANDAPVAVADAFSTDEDVPLNVAAPGVLANDTDTEGSTLTAVLVSGPANGTLTLNADGSFGYTPNANFNGADSFTYKANDGTSDSNTVTVTITVNPVNDAPVAVADAYSVNEDNALNVPAPGVLANDTDPEGSSLTAVLVTGPANGTLTLNANGSFTYTPNANYNGSDSFSYKANDGTLDSNTVTVTIPVNSVNDVPVAVADAYSTDEDVQLNVAAPGVLANDADIEGSTLTAVLVSGPANGTLTLNANGSFTYTPNANYNGSDSFTYKANDGTDDSNTVTVTLTINTVNDAPVAVADAYSVNEDNALNVAAPGVLGNDSDVEGSSLTAVLVTGPANGTLTLNADGSFTYTPNANYNGGDSFTYKANDGTLDSNTVAVAITVNSVNDLPVAVADAYSTDEDVQLNVAAPGVLANDTDVESSLTAVLVSGPANGTLTLNADGSFSYTPNANYNGGDSFTYKANDGTDDSNTVTVTLTINAINDAPTAVADAYSTDEDVQLNVPAPGVLGNDSDVEGSSLTAILVTGPANGTLTLNADGSFTYTPNANYNGSDNFSYKANDGTLDSNTVIVTITVNSVNDTPAAVADAYATNEDTPLNVSAPGVLANDTDADNSLTAVLVSGTTNGSLTLNADGSFSYTPNANYNGSDSFTYKANDGTTDSNTVTVTIAVNAVNDPPAAVADAYSTDEDVALNVPAPGVLANDSDVEGSSLTAILVTGPASGTLTLNANGSFTYTPNANFNGSDSFTYKANDGTSDSNTVAVTITVNSLNDMPVAVADAYATNEDTALNVSAPGVLTNDTDPDNTLTAILVSGTTNGALTLNADGSFSYTPNANFSGSDSFTYKANDGTTDSNTVAVTITVNAVNDPPVAVADAYSTNEDVALNVPAPGVLTNDTDPEGSALTAVLVTGPTSGTLTLNANGSFTYTPNPNFNGADSFTYKANDGTADSNTVTVTITVNSVPDIPAAVADAYSVDEDTVLNVPAPGVLTNDTDADGDPITAILVSTTTNGTLTLSANGSFTYTPNANYNGSDSFTYKANDGTNDSNVVTVTITVNPVNDQPDLPDATRNINENSANGTNVGAVLPFTDPDTGQTYTFAITNGNTGGAFAVSNSGQITVANSAQLNYEATQQFVLTVQITDSGTPNLSDTATVTININDVNEAPVATADAMNYIGGTEHRADGHAGTTNALAFTTTSTNPIDNDTDPDTLNPSFATLTIVPAGPSLTANNGVYRIEADGTMYYTPPPGFSGTDTVPYQLTDGTNTVNGSITMTMTGTDVVWYVRNNDPTNDGIPQNNGTSSDPFNTLVEAQTASGVNHIIYVHVGDGTNTGQNAGITLKNGQDLIGNGVALVVNGSTTLIGAGTRPSIHNTAGDGVTATNLTGNVIRGLNISGSDDGISMSTTGVAAGGIEISENVISATTNFGIRVATGSTGTSTISIHDNTVSGTAAAMDITRTAGTTYITAFDDNVVPGTSGGGIVMTGSGGVITFDAVPGGGINPVAGGITTIGTSVDRINNSGLVLLNVAGTLSFTDLDIFTDANAALIADGGVGGFTFTVAPTVATIVANAGGAVALTDITALDLQLAGMTSTNSASEGVSLVNVTGTFSAPTGSTITNAAGTDFFISGGTVNSTYNGTITDDVGTLVSIANSTGGTKAFTGAISDGFDGDGSGISISGNNASTTISFSGGLSLATGANAAFMATGAGTLTITDPAGATSNRISTTNGTGLSISGGVQIGAAGLTFESINVDGNDALPVNGIVLNGTGSAGGLTITGTGVANSGGTIRDTSDDAISLTNVAKISLARMNITSNLGSGIFGNGVNGFVVADSSITLNGNDAGADESGIIISELSGTNGGAFPTSITNTTISNNFEFELSITNNGAAVLSNLAMSGNTISADGTQPNHGNLFNFLSFGTGSMTLNLTSGTFTGNTDTSGGKIVTATAVQCDHSGSGGTMTCNVSNATFTNNNVGPQASVAANGQMVIDFNNNNIQGSRAIGVNIFADANAPYTKTIQGRIRNNTIGTNGVPDSGSATGFPIRVQNEGRVNITLVIDNNDVFEADNAGINLNHGISSANGTGTSALTIINNSVTNITASRAIIINQNDIIGGGAHGTVCVDISANAFSGIAGQAGDGTIIRLREGAQTGGTATFNVRQQTPTGAVNAAELDDANGITAAQISISGTPTFNAGTCAQPIN